METIVSNRVFQMMLDVAKIYGYKNDTITIDEFVSIMHRTKTSLIFDCDDTLLTYNGNHRCGLGKLFPVTRDDLPNNELVPNRPEFVSLIRELVDKLDDQHIVIMSKPIAGDQNSWNDKVKKIENALNKHFNISIDKIKICVNTKTKDIMLLEHLEYLRKNDMYVPNNFVILDDFDIFINDTKRAFTYGHIPYNHAIFCLWENM